MKIACSFRHKAFLVLIWLFIANNLIAQFTISGDFSDAISFESVVPSTWAPEAGSNLSLATDRYKHGSKSLKWSWSLSGKRITVTEPSLIANSTSRNSGIYFWLFSEKNLSDSIHFIFYDENHKQVCDFYYRINFKGWRTQWISYTSDLGKAINTSIASLEIIAPLHANSGTLWFDLVEFKKDVLWSRVGSFQFDKPYEQDPSKPATRALAYKTNYLRYGNGPEIAPVPSAITSSMIQDVNMIEQRMEEYLLGSGEFASNSLFITRKKAIQSSFADAHTYFLSLNITDNGNGVYSGMPIFGQMHTLSETKKYKPNTEDISGLAIKLAYDYRMNGNIQSKDDFIKLMDYIDQQGWSEGSSLGALHYMGQYTEDFHKACFLMRDVLRNEQWENGQTKLDRSVKMIFWCYDAYSLFAAVDAPMNINCDDVGTEYNHVFWAILMMNDTDKNKYWYLDQFVKRHEQVVLNTSIDSAALLGEYERMLHPDYIGYHHFGPAVSSYFRSTIIETMAQACFLNGTQFSFNSATKDVLKQTALTLRYISQQYDFPKGISMRWSGLGQGAQLMPGIGLAAIASGTNGIPDAELTAALNRLWNPQHPNFKLSASFKTLGELEACLKVMNAVQPAETLTGFRIHPYACLASFRGNNWLASLYGHSRFVWNGETSATEDIHGGYDGHGQLSILVENATKSSQESSGLTYGKGYDWRYVPGATTLEIPLSKLDSFKTWTMQESAFVGGVQHKQKNGVWVMDYKDNVNQPGNAFKKSVFFFGNNEIICLGTGISNSENSKTMTTLFQSKIDDANPGSQPNYINGTSISTFPYDNSTLTGAIFLKDPYGNTFYIPSPEALRIKRQLQTSVELNSNATTSGRWSLAYLDHGIAPVNKGYEYAIFIQANQNQIDLFASNPTYSVLIRNEKAHIVKYRPSHQTGYAVFDASTMFTKATGLLKSVSAPLVLMIEESSATHIEVSASDPDLMPKNTAETIEVRGKWMTQNSQSGIQNIFYTDSTTIFQVFFKEGKSFYLDLIPKTTVGLNDDAAIPFINVYPNPSNEWISIESSPAELQKLKILNALGEDVSDMISIYKEQDNKVNLNISLLPNGIFILETVHTFKKIVITR